MKYFKLITIAIITLLLFSCSEDFFEKSIDLGVEDHTSKLATTAFLGTNENDFTLVSYSIGALEDDDAYQQIVKNATVSLQGENIDTHLVYNDETKMYTSTPLPFEVNKTYSMTVSAPNYETITATQTYPEQVPILSATLSNNLLKINFDDNANSNDFYALEVLEQNDDGSYYSIYLEPFGSSTKYSAFFEEGLLFSDDTFNGTQNHEIAARVDYYNENRNHKVILYHITEDFYRYDITLDLSFENDGNPFVEPIILHRNFENGYGVFLLANKSEFILE